MRILSVAYKNHPIFGHLELDLTDPDSRGASPTVIIAGENGTGKTLLLEELYRVLGDVNLSVGAFGPGNVEIALETSVSEIPHWTDRLNTPEIIAAGLDDWDRVVHLRFGPAAYPGNWDSYQMWINLKGQQYGISPPAVFNLPHRPIKIFYNESEISFRAGPVTASGGNQLDTGENYRRSGDNLAQHISQLLVDIRSADAEEAQQWIEANPGAVPPPNVVDRRMRRFKEAIAYIFPSKRFSRVGRYDGRLVVEFDEAGLKSDISNLTTGEKQIVFRGGFLLRDLDLIQDAVVLVDEPELGLHPSWQQRIVGFYSRLFPNLDAGSSQLIFTTHSPFIVHDQVNGKVVILRRSPLHGVQVDPEPSYPASGQERVVSALNVPALIAKASKDMIVLVEGETDADILATAWSRLRSTPLPFELRAALSKSGIRTILNDDQLFRKNPGKSLVGVFDFDTAWSDWNGIWKGEGQLVVAAEEDGLTRRHPSGAKGWAMLLPVPASRSYLASSALRAGSMLSIELLFQDSDLLPGMIDRVPLPAPGVTAPVVKDNFKSPFAAHVQTLPALAFSAFEPIFRNLEAIRSGTI